MSLSPYLLNQYTRILFLSNSWRVCTIHKSRFDVLLIFDIYCNRCCTAQDFPWTIAAGTIILSRDIQENLVPI